MKTIILTVINLVLCISCFSQTEKGKKYIGGLFNISENSDERTYANSYLNYDLFSFQLSPRMGFLVKDNLSLGFNVNFQIGNQSNEYEFDYSTTASESEKINTTTYGAGVFVRSYKKIIDNLFLFANGGINYDHQISKLEQHNDDPSYIYPPENPANQEAVLNTLSVVVSPGIQYFLSPKIGVETSFGSLYYKSTKGENKDVAEVNTESSGYGINLNSSTFTFGFSFYF